MELNTTARRNAVVFVTVSLVAGFGGNAMILTSGVWVMDLTGDAGLAALAAACFYLPSIAGPLLGAVADRVPRRPLLVRTCLVAAAVLLTLLAVRGPGQVWLILVVMLGYGAALAVTDAAEAGLLPAALPGAALGTVNGLRMSAQEGVKLVAPLAGAGLFTLAGAPPVITLSAALLAGSALLYAALRLPADVIVRAPGDAAAVRARGGWWSPWVVGAGHLRGQPGLGAIVLVAAGGMAAAGLGAGVLYAIIDDGLGRAPAFAGVLSAVQGGGALLGGLAAGRIMARPGRRIAGETLLAALGGIVLAAALLLRAVPWLPAVLAGSLLTGIGLPWAIVAAFTAIQRGTPQAILGRVSATANSLIFAAPAFATPAGALFLRWGGYRPVLLGAAVLSLAGGVLLLTRAAPFRPGR